MALTFIEIGSWLGYTGARFPAIIFFVLSNCWNLYLGLRDPVAWVNGMLENEKKF